MALIGSPEWFHDKAKTKEMNDLRVFVENLRSAFLERFSPEKLLQMNGRELLQNVFGDSRTTMMQILMNDDDYRWFGAPGNYKYLGIVYKVKGSSWKYMEGKKAIVLDEAEAIQKAEDVRDKLIQCIKSIEEIGIFRRDSDYEVLQDKLGEVFFSSYSWAIKYYQMIYPQFFRGMYAEKTIERALSILGLPQHGKNRLVNDGEISLFIRRCDVNNIVFNTIYGNEWDWEKDDDTPCQNVRKNFNSRNNPVNEVNLSYYAV